jgi:hypothetical protein
VPKFLILFLLKLVFPISFRSDPAWSCAGSITLLKILSQKDGKADYVPRKRFANGKLFNAKDENRCGFVMEFDVSVNVNVSFKHFFIRRNRH